MGLTDLGKRMAALKILVVGDIMIDRYIYGSVDRISPEAPIPVVSYQRIDARAGGAANVAFNLSELGVQTYLASIIGKDDKGEQLLSILKSKNIDSETIIASNSRKTTSKTRILAQGQHLLRIDEEDTFDLNEKEHELLISKVKNLLEESSFDALIFQDYNKGCLTEKLIEEITSIAIEKSIPIAVDPKRKNFYAYKGVSLFKPNFKEVNEQIPFELEKSLEHMQQANSYLKSKLNNAITLITLSEKGIFVADKKEGQILPTHPRKILDVCGAGDSVISVASVGLALGVSPQLIAELGNIAGGQVCGKMGVVPVNKEELLEEIENRGLEL